MQVLFSVIITVLTLGFVPPDAQFEVEVACDATDPAAQSAQFGHQGGTDELTFQALAAPVDCTVTEPVTGGASSVTIDPAEFTLENPNGAIVEVLVTNTFAEPVPPVPPSPPEPAPVEIEPTFTG